MNNVGWLAFTVMFKHGPIKICYGVIIIALKPCVKETCCIVFDMLGSMLGFKSCFDVVSWREFKLSILGGQEGTFSSL